MYRRIWGLSLLLGAVLLLTGCGSRNLEEMYALPKRSQEYAQLQSAIDSAMYGLSYSAPRSGENQQTVQMADLDGDGVDEYLVFAKGASERPLQVLIFKEEPDGTIRTLEIIGSNGQAFEQVEYIQFDDQPGLELVMGLRLSDQIMRSVAVYSFRGGQAQLQLLTGYSRFAACDLDEDGDTELMVIRPQDGEAETGVAILYGYHQGQISRSVEVKLSQRPSEINRLKVGRLQDNMPAVYVTSTVDNQAVVTDVFAVKNGYFTNVAFFSPADTTVHTLQNCYIYPEDIDGDGIMELPELIAMKSVSGWQDEEQKYLLRWYSLDLDGWPTDKLVTYHNYAGGWYLTLDHPWAGRTSVEPGRGSYTFYLWDESYQSAIELFTLFVFTGSDRDELAVADGRFALYRTEGVAYAGQLSPDAPLYDISKEHLIESFHLIFQDWEPEQM